MNETNPITIKTVLLLLLAFALIYFQINASQKLSTVENQLNQLRNEINSINGLISQQNFMITEEKADYRFYGITYENELLNSKVGVLSMKMNLSFTKLPSDAEVFIEVQGSEDHFPPTNGEPGINLAMLDADMKYGESQTIAFNVDGLNRFTSDMVFDIGQNYKLTLIVKTPNDTFSEMLGVVPALEWSEPAHYATVEVLNLSSSLNTANFNYKMALMTLEELNSGFSFYDAKNLYDFKNLDVDKKNLSNSINDVVKARYKITYLDKVIKEGELSPYSHPETGVESWIVEDKVEFEVDASTDFVRSIQIEFTTIDNKGNVESFTRGVFQ